MGTCTQCASSMSPTQTATEVAVEVDSGEDAATEEDWRFAYPVCLRAFMTTSSGLGESNEKPSGGENVGTGGVCFFDFLRCFSLLALESSSENGDAVPSARLLSSLRLQKVQRHSSSPQFSTSAVMMLSGTGGMWHPTVVRPGRRRQR